MTGDLHKATADMLNRVTDAILFHPGNRGGTPEHREAVSRELARTALEELQPELDELAAFRAAKEPSCAGFEPRMTLGWNDCDPVAVCHCGARLAGDSVNDAVLAWTGHLTTAHKGEW